LTINVSQKERIKILKQSTLFCKKREKREREREREREERNCQTSNIYRLLTRFCFFLSWNLTKQISLFFFFWLMWVLDRGPEWRESNLTVLCLLIFIILISYIIIFYTIFKLSIMENHPSQNPTNKSLFFICFKGKNWKQGAEQDLEYIPYKNTTFQMQPTIPAGKYQRNNTFFNLSFHWKVIIGYDIC
jgi:hypothetical protein